MNTLAKLAVRLIKKVLEKRIPSKAINHIIAYSQYQEDNGIVEGGVHRSDIKQEGSMAVSTHYRCINTLQEEEVYSVDKENKNIKIIDNNFTNESGDLDFKGNNYIELPNFIHESKFQYAPVMMKRLVLYLFSLGTKDSYANVKCSTLQKVLHLNRPEKVFDLLRVLDQKGWFYIERDINKEGEFKFHFKLKNVYAGTSRLKHNKKQENKVKQIFRRKKIEWNPKELADFVQLLNQYKDNFFNCLKYLTQQTAKGNIFRGIICKHIAYN